MEQHVKQNKLIEGPPDKVDRTILKNVINVEIVSCLNLSTVFYKYNFVHKKHKILLQNHFQWHFKS